MLGCHGYRLCIKISVVIKQYVLVTRNSSVGPGFLGPIDTSVRQFSCVCARKVCRKFDGMLRYYGFEVRSMVM